MSEVQRQKIENALMKLPLINGAEEKVSSTACTLELKCNLMRINELPGAKITTKKKSIEELNEIGVSAFILKRRLSQLHLNSKEALNLPKNLNTIMIEEYLKSLGIAADQGITKLLVSAEEGRKGAPSKKLASKVTEYAGKYFKDMTGLNPGVATRQIGTQGPQGGSSVPYGPFYDFLGELFVILNIEASPESQIKKFLKIKA